MKRTLLLSLVLGVGAVALVRAAFTPTQQPGAVLPEPPQAPHDIQLRVIEAHPFTLETPEKNWMSPEAPAYQTGTVLVVEGPQERFLPRQTLENVLYVGTQMPEWLNTGEFSGRRVLLVPGPFDAQAPIFFGTPELPERVTEDEAARQMALAVDAGAATLENVELASPRQFPDGVELRRFGADLIERYAPDEVDVISGLRAKRL